MKNGLLGLVLPGLIVMLLAACGGSDSGDGSNKTVLCRDSEVFEVKVMMSYFEGAGHSGRVECFISM